MPTLTPDANFAPSFALARTPAGSAPFPPFAFAKDGACQGTRQSVLSLKEQERCAAEQQQLQLLAAARIEHFNKRRALLCYAKEQYIPAAIVLDWSNNNLSIALTHSQDNNSAKQQETGERGEACLVVSEGELAQQWMELVCLLRSSIVDEESLSSTQELVAASLAFLDEVKALCSAQAEPPLHGTVYQELLKDLAQCGIAGAMVDNAGVGNQDTVKSMHEVAKDSEMAAGLKCADRWAGLMKGANTIRNLVRIKLQDDNDLHAARLALDCCDACFSQLRLHANKKGISNYEMVLILEGN